MCQEGSFQLNSMGPWGECSRVCPLVVADFLLPASAENPNLLSLMWLSNKSWTFITMVHLWVAHSKILMDSLIKALSEFFYNSSQCFWVHQMPCSYFLSHIVTFKKNFFLKFWLHSTACGTLAPQPGIKPMPLALEVQSLNHRTTRDIPVASTLLDIITCWVPVTH